MTFLLDVPLGAEEVDHLPEPLRGKPHGRRVLMTKSRRYITALGSCTPPWGAPPA